MVYFIVCFYSVVISDFRELAGRRVVKQSAVTNKQELVEKQKRKQVLEALSDIVQKKRRSLDVDEHKAEDQFLAVDDDDISATLSGMPEIQKALPERKLTSGSTALDKRNVKSRENQVKHVVKEANRHDTVNHSSLKESFVDLPSKSKQSSNRVVENRKHTKADAKQSSDPVTENRKDSKADKRLPVVDGSPSVSSHHLQPAVSPVNKSKCSSEKSLLGPASDNDHVLGAVVDAAAPVKHVGKVAVVSGCEVKKKSNDEPNDFSSKAHNQQLCVQEAEDKRREVCAPLLITEHESEDIRTETDRPKPLSLATTGSEYLNDQVDPFAFSPPRKVRLKFRDGSNKPSADTPGQTSSTVTDITASPMRLCINSNSLSLDSKQHEQLPEDLVKNYKQFSPGKKQPLLGHSPAASRHCVQRPASRGFKRTSSGSVKTLLGPCPRSVGQNEPAVGKFSKKPFPRLDAQSGESAKLDRNSYQHCRGQRTYPRSPATGVRGRGRFKPVVERSDWLKNGRDIVPQDQSTPRSERETEFENERRQRQEEASLQERERALRRERDEWLKTEYNNRCDMSLRQEGVFDLREKLNSRYRNSNWQRGGEDCSYNRRAHSPVSFANQERNPVDDTRRYQLHDPDYHLRGEIQEDEYRMHKEYRMREIEFRMRGDEYRTNEDECRVVDDPNYETQRRRHNSLLGDPPGHLRDNSQFRHDDDSGNSWMNVDRRYMEEHWQQSREYSAPLIKQEPRHDWTREVGQFSYSLLKKGVVYFQVWTIRNLLKR